MFAAFGLLVIPVLAGALLTYVYDRGSPLAARFCTGACTGLGLFAGAGFLFAAALPGMPLAVYWSEAALAFPLALLAWPAGRRWARREAARAAEAVQQAAASLHCGALFCCIFYGFLLLLLWLVFDRALFERPDGLYTGFANNLGDLPFHLQVIASFAHGQNIPPEDPAYAGRRFTYPFLADFLAAMLVRGGASLRGAMLAENVVLGLALAGVLHRWTRELTRDRLAGLLAPPLVFFSGGFGWWLLLGDLRGSEHGIWGLLRRLPHDYTILGGSQWRWGNALTALLVPQRSILFGLPVAVCIFTQWWLACGGTRQGQRAAGPMRRMIAAGVFAGLLPLIHTYSFAVVMAMAACLALLFGPRRAWGAFFTAALLLSLPELLWLMPGAGAQARSFLGWRLGWDRGGNNAVWFWLKNTGLFLPLLAAAAWRAKAAPDLGRLLRFYLPFTLCFAAPNLVRLAPWIWDNIKVLFYWYVASVPLVAWLLSRLWQRGGKQRAAAAAFFAALTLAGGLDVWRAVSGAAQYREFDRQGIAMAEQIIERTAPRSLILHAPVFHSPVFLTGRRSLLGYPGWVWSRGIDYAPREEEIRRVYSGGLEARAVIGRYRVEYVLIGPQETAAMPVDEAYFARYPKAAEAGAYRLYKIAAQ
jgi:hypothetical protein